MKKKIVFGGILGMIAMSFFAQNAMAVVNYTPSNPNVDERVDFNLIPIGPPPSVTWDFGDGIMQVGGGENFTHLPDNRNLYG